MATKRGVLLLLLGTLSAMAAAQEVTPRTYSSAETVEAARHCLESIRELEANTRRFPIEEFDKLVRSKDDVAKENVATAFRACVLYRLENKAAEVVPLS